MKQYTLTLEDETQSTVSFDVICEADAYRPYGISAELVNTATQERDSAAAHNRFATREEAEATIQMLCDNQVTPCTLCDIL